MVLFCVCRKKTTRNITNDQNPNSFQDYLAKINIYYAFIEKKEQKITRNTPVGSHVADIRKYIVGTGS